MNRSAALFITVILLLTVACRQSKPVCLSNSVTYVADPAQFPTLTPPVDGGPSPAPELVTIGNKRLPVDKVIHGPLCNDTWSGTVYVACDIQVAKWADTPNFLQNCNLDIEPGTIVYVAAHNNAAYYKGCSCHAGEVPGE